MVKPIILDRAHWEIVGERLTVICPGCGYRGRPCCGVSREGVVGAPLSCPQCTFHGECIQLEGWGGWGPD